MKKLMILCFCICLFASNTGASTERGGHKSVIKTTTSVKDRAYPTPFRKLSRWFKRLLGMDQYICLLTVPNVDYLSVRPVEIFHRPSCSESAPTEQVPQIVEVSTEARDPENDVITYKYIVSAGRVTGEGPKVKWDLTGVPPGRYTITAGVDDGAGVVGITQTRGVEILDCDRYPLRETD